MTVIRDTMVVRIKRTDANTMTVVIDHSSRIKPTEVCPHFIEVEWPVRRFTIDEYHRMGEIELFRQEEHFELLNGLLIWNTDRMDMGKVQKSNFLHTELPLRRFSIHNITA